MGLGGDLMWTELAKQIHRKEGKKVCFIDKKNKVKKSCVWLENPDISFSKKNTFLIKRSEFTQLPEKITGDKNKWNISQHTILSRCKYFGYTNPMIQCHMYFTHEEETHIKKIISKLPKNFIVVEPHTKTDWTKNKKYSFSKWQTIVDEISKEIPVIQMSIPNTKSLKNVINVSNKIRNFREAVLFLKYAKLFVASEGGLMHGANAVGTQSIIIFSPIFNPKYTKYPNTEAIWIGNEKHSNCFNNNCEKCHKMMKNHNEKIIINKIKLFLRPCYSGSPAFDYH